MSSQMAACAVLIIALSTVSAQVASHAPTVAPKAETTSASSQPVGKPLLRVNGAVLTEGDLAREIAAIFPYARQHNGGVPQSMGGDIRQGAAKMMVFEELVYQEAKRRNMTVSADRMQRGIAEFQKQFTSQEEYDQFLQDEFHGDRTLLRAKIERSLLIDELLKLEVTNKAVVSVAEAKAYFDKHPERFRIPESFAFQSISLLPPTNATAAQLKEAHKRAEDALRQAKATKNYEQFGMLAEKLSEDDFRVMMGDHQAADRSKLPPTIVTAVAAMQPGQVSDIIEFAPNAFTILRLNAHIPDGMQTFAAAKNAIIEQLTKEKTEQLRSALAAKLSKNAKIEKL
jgi:hypothetical protein